MELRDDRLIIPRELSELDRDVVAFTSILDDADVDVSFIEARDRLQRPSDWD